MLRLEQSDLLAVRLSPGPNWLEVIQQAWDSGAAVLPVDHRLSEAEVASIYREARPTMVLDGPEPPRRLPQGAPIDPAVALVVTTSGSTGTPKPAELTHAGLRAAVEASAARLGSTGRDPWLCCLPPAHMGGMLVILRALLTGAPVKVHPGFDVEQFESESEARFTSLVPTMIVRLLEAGAQLARFNAILSGGAALPPSLAERARAAGARLVPTYGLTESCGGVVYDGVALDGTEVRIGEEGEVQLRGPALMRGYRLDPKATAAAFTNDGWLKTRDAGALVEGRLRVFGRLDGVINTGGEKVWPEEVEEAIRTHAGVLDVLVFGRPDPEWGERVVARVVPSDPGSPPTLEDLRDHVTQKLAKFKAPREIVLTKALPRTPLGKLLRTPPPA